MIGAAAELTEREVDIALAGGFLGFIFSFLAIFLVAWFVLLIVASWKMFTKAGQPGWKSVIPVYNVWTLYKIAKVNFWVWLVIPAIVCGVAQPMLVNAGNNPNAFVVIFAVVAIIYGIVADWKLCKGISQSFGKGAGFAVGMFFFPNIFQLIIGFGKAKYKKK